MPAPILILPAGRREALAAGGFRGAFGIPGMIRRAWRLSFPVAGT